MRNILLTKDNGRLLLEAETLSDGDRVYNVLIRVAPDEEEIRICCTSKAAAETVLATLTNPAYVVGIE